MEDPEIMEAWLEGLRERGYVVGQNLQIEYRFWRARTERIPGLVAELVAFGPEVIVAATTPSVVAVQRNCRSSGVVVGLVARYQLPAMYFERKYVLEGGLLSYGPSLADNCRLCGQDPEGRGTW